jgi:hypothetical protein
MQSLLTSVLMGLLRYILAGITGWMITNGIADEQQIGQLIAGLAGALILIGSLWWVKYRDRVLVLTALKMPPRSTPEDLAAAVKLPDPTRNLGVLLAIGLGAALLAGCATGRTVIDPSPDAASVTATQREALRATEGLKTGLQVTRQLGADLPQLGLPAAEARALDCAILRATGTSTPASAAVVSACGPVALAPDAPIARALDGLKAVTSCPGLQSTLATVRPFTTPLLDRLDQSSSAAVRVIGASLRLSFAVLTPGGVSC